MISLGAMQLAKKVPFDDPNVLTVVRIGYLASQALCVGVYLYISYKIKQKNDMTVLKYVEPKNPLSSDQPNLVVTTNRDYDLEETSKLLRAVYMGVAMMTFLHLYMKYTQPLFVQGLMGIKGLYEAKPVALYIFGKPAEGDLKRPFKQPPGMFGANSPATDKASIAAAEGKPAPKEE
ncbi:hypothetical protein M408DRAFT_326041 [Serendipita vermifera MAFF 305830]|uniref:Inorganic phosphate transporter n=1 Tax=Serendipita vermifera MAFF 305830 TaxID=933852 RepID=A0A0C3B8X3_SERVB|nr:hypothetical protein M408DRAFT_326041 [Serendipita vermifera MAFF 305830]